jgi:uncharacterized protein YdeI (YjbR/CyaY-like superfamily)
MKPTFFATPADFRAWMAANHAKEKELLVGFYKVGSGKPSITWPQSVDEALCFGWIDGVRRSLGDVSYTIRFTPRRTGSIWSALNTRRFAQLKKAGLIGGAGAQAYAGRRAARSGVYSFEQKQQIQLAPEQQRALDANRAASRFFLAQAPWYQRAARWWVISAKRPDTRAKRLRALIVDSEAGRTIAPLTRTKTERGGARVKPAVGGAGRRAAKGRA